MMARFSFKENLFFLQHKGVPTMQRTPGVGPPPTPPKPPLEAWLRQEPAYPREYRTAMEMVQLMNPQKLRVLEAIFVEGKVTLLTLTAYPAPGNKENM